VSRRERAAIACFVVAVLAYLVSLGPVDWAVAGSEGSALFELLGTSSAVNSFLSVMYLLLTLVVVGLGGAGLLSPPPRSRGYAVTARLAWLLDLGCVAGIGYRIAQAGDGIGFGPGWYVAVLAVIAVGAAALAVPARGEPAQDASVGGAPVRDG
jgi:hypothetical protein